MRASYARRSLPWLALVFGCAFLRCSSFSGADDTPTGSEGGEASSPDAGAGSDSDGETDAALAIVGDPIPLMFGGCGSLSACESDPTGDWQITGGCVDESVFDVAKTGCASLLVTDASFTARGALSVEGTTFAQQISETYMVTFDVPSSCRKGLPCDYFTTAYGQGGANVHCVDDGDAGCTCPISNAMLDTVSAQYSRAAGVITVGATGSSGPRTFSYCAQSNGLISEETTSMAPRVTFTWKRR